MKKCPVCHTETEDSAKFCPECGNPFPAETKPEDHSEATENPVTETGLSTDASAGSVNFVLQDDSEPAQTVEEVITESPAQSAENNTTDASAPQTTQPAGERWYYVEAGKSKGPFSKDQFLDLIVDGTITPATYVWTKGMDEWTYLKNTPLYGGESQPAENPQPQSYEQKPAEDSFASASAYANQSAFDANASAADYQEEPSADEEQKWFYVVKNRTVGPFSREVMIRNTEQGVLEPNTYVWCEGYDDWKHLSDTPFAKYIPSNDGYSESTFTGGNGGYSQKYGGNGGYSSNGYNTNGYNTTGVQRRSVLLYLLLSILTCGIFDIIWYYMVASDINKLCLRRGRQPLADPILVLVFSFLTCGIYSVYFFWKAGTTVYELSDRRLTDNSVVLAILGWLLQPAALAVLQNQINTVVDHNDYLR